MLHGIDSLETTPFSCKDDTSEPKTIFHIANLPSREKIAIIGELVDQEGRVSSKKIMPKAVDLFIKGVVKIENIHDPKTQKAVTLEKIDESVVDMVPFEVVCEVAAEVVERNFVQGAERKK